MAGDQLPEDILDLGAVHAVVPSEVLDQHPEGTRVECEATEGIDHLRPPRIVHLPGDVLERCALALGGLLLRLGPVGVGDGQRGGVQHRVVHEVGRVLAVGGGNAAPQLGG